MTRSILSNWLGLVAVAGCTVFLTPIMIHDLGAVDFGVWVLAGSVLDYYGLLDIGMRAAMFRYVGLFRGSDAREEIDRTFSSALFVVTVTAVLICLVSVIVAHILSRSMTLRGTSPHEFRSLLSLLGFSVAVTFPVRMLATYISAHQRWDLFNAAGTAAVLTRTLAIIAVLKLGYGLVAVAAVALIVAVLSLFQHVLFLRIADPAVRLSTSLISVKRIRELFAFSVRSLLVSIGDYLRFYSDSVVIAAILNVALVTPFNVATRLIECFKSVVIAAGGPVLGSMTEMDGGSRREESRTLLMRSTRMLSLLSIVGGVLLLVDGRVLLRIWLGTELRIAYPILAVLAAGYMINLALHPMLLIVVARGRHGALGAWTIAEGIANVGLSILWGRSHGLVGVALGTVVPMLVIKLIVQPYYALKAAEITFWTFFNGGLVRPLLVAPLFTLAAGTIARYATPTLSLFIAIVLAQLAIFVTISWVLGLTRMERNSFRKYTQHRLRLLLCRIANPLGELAKPVFSEKE